MIGNIGIVHISPEADRAGEILPHSLVFPNAFFAKLDKRLKTVFFYLLLAVDAEHLFNLKLNGQTVSIPARFTGNHIALHCAVSRNHILDNAGQNMADMGLAVCRGRSVIKSIGGAALSFLNAFLENMVFFPEIKHGFFSGDEIHIRRNLFVHYPFLRFI